MIKRFIILILTPILCMLSIVSAAAKSADEMPKEAVYLLDMGVINAYSPDAAVTKQTVQTSVEMLGVIIKDTYFPQNDFTEAATVEEAAAVLTDLTGRGTYLTRENIMTTAISAGITEVSKHSADEYLTMDAYVKMLWQALNAKKIEMSFESSGVGYSVGEGTYLGDNLKIYEIKGTVSATDRSGLFSKNDKANDGCIKIGNTELKTKDYKSRGYEFLGMTVSALYRVNDGEYELVSVYASAENNKTVTVNAADIETEKTDLTRVTAYTDKTHTYKISADAAFIYNGVAAEYMNDRDIKIGEGSITLMSRGGSEYDTVRITAVESTVISQLSEDNARIVGKNNKQYDLDELVNYNGGAIYDENGNETAFSSLKKGDAVSIGYEIGTANIVFVQKGKTVRGEVTAMQTDGVFIEGSKFGIAASLKNGSSGYSDDILKIGADVKAYINAFGDIIGAETDGKIDLYGYMIKLYEDTKSGEVFIKLFGEDNEFHTYEVRSKIILNDDRVSRSSLMDKSRAAIWNGGKVRCQPVRYRANADGMLTRIYTAADNNRYASYSDGEFSLDYSGELKYLTGDWQSLGGLYRLKSDTVIINVPYSVSDEDLFYTVSPTSWGNWTFDIELYDVDEEFCVGLALLRKSDYTLQQASFKGNKPIVVREIEQVENENGETVYEIRGWRSGAEYKIRTRREDTYATLIPNEIKKLQNLDLPPVGNGKNVFYLSDLEPGAVIQPMLNNGCLTGFTLFYDGKIPVYYEYSTYTLPAAITETECMVLSGRVYDLTQKGFLYTKNAPGEEISVMRNITVGSGVKVYLSENGKVYECTRDEIMKDDKILLYYDYETLNTVVLQR